MRKKDTVRRIEDMTDALDAMTMVTSCKVSHDETEAVLVGLMAGLLEAQWMLEHEEPEGIPEEQACRAYARAVNVYVDWKEAHHE